MDPRTSTQSISNFQKELDPNKHALIVSKLCAKRKSIEDVLKKTDLEATVREDEAIHLIEIKKDLEAFGISEIDYQVFLINLEKETGEPKALQ